MGMAKRMWEEAEGVRDVALSVLCDSKVLRECDRHSGEYFEGSEDIEDAYRIANARITRGAITLPDGYTRRDFTDAMKEVHEEWWALDSCNYCATIAARDD